MTNMTCSCLEGDDLLQFPRNWISYFHNLGTICARCGSNEGSLKLYFCATTSGAIGPFGCQPFGSGFARGAVWFVVKPSTKSFKVSHYAKASEVGEACWRVSTAVTLFWLLRVQLLQ